MAPWAATLAFASATSIGISAESPVPLKNPAFVEGSNSQGVPLGWNKYGGRGKRQRIAVIGDDRGKSALLIEDGDPEAEVGITQVVSIKPNVGYEASVLARSVTGASELGANVQLRFLPSNTYVQTHILTQGPDDFCETTVRGVAPPDATNAVIYIYTHAAPTPSIVIGGVGLTAGVKPPEPIPPPIPPQYTQLKDLHRTTWLIRDHRPLVRIVAPSPGTHDRHAARLQAAIRKLTGCTVPIIADSEPEAAVPIKGPLIVLGNRSTNATIGELYNRFFLLTDLRYPGPGGHEIRTIHNPCGGGHNVILVGASDSAGLDRAIDALVAKLSESSANGSLSVGWLMDLRLGEGLAMPRDLQQMEIWEASAGYRSSGYFGWNSISKRMAAYYMSGDPHHAREAIRLSFPDKRAFGEITEIDGEMIENKDDPLAGPYHYNAHMMILFWDLIEESPLFTDELRLRVTNAFSRQLAHRKGEGVYPLARTPNSVGSRHGQWSAISLYCLGRYFQRDYPDRVWDQCVAAAGHAFASLKHHAWINGENDNLFWYCTGISPVFTHMLLSGDRTPMTNGVAAALLRGQEILISGRSPDWALQSASLDYFHKVAHMTRDGRWLTYRDRTGVSTNSLRLGQSFWPPDQLRPSLPQDLVGKWTANPLPTPHWAVRKSGIPLENSIYNASFRTTTGADGDFILIDCFNGASRNPYHTFAILELRIAGKTLLQGYLNQVLTKADGAVEPRVAMDAAILDQSALGETAICIAETPRAAFCNWRRTLAQRVGRYAIVVDDLTYRCDSENMEVQLKWEIPLRPLRFETDSNRLLARDGVIAPADSFETKSIAGGIATQKWMGPVKDRQHGIFFTLVAPDTNAVCSRISHNAAALALPERAIVFAGKSDAGDGDLVIASADHIFGKALRSIGPNTTLLRSNEPIDVDWNLSKGRMEIHCTRPTSLSISCANPDAILISAPTPHAEWKRTGDSFQLPAGRLTLDAVKPADHAITELHGIIETLAMIHTSTGATRAAVPPAAPPPPQLNEIFATHVGEAVSDFAVFSEGKRELVGVAHANKIDLIATDGSSIAQTHTDGNIRQLHWWPEERLLLAGCEDEKVFAFDAMGKPKWTFVSQMDPAVFRAAKQYWFKSAPGHGGIHGLDTGVFLNGKSQAFIGSACTLEILDRDGKLLRRLPQFWGTVYKFAIVPADDGALNLLASRRITDGPSLAIINNRTLDPTPRGFYGVPPDHTHVSGWMDQTRHHIFVDDLDADGRDEVISEITGAWNRLTVWDLKGHALSNAQFGPGARNLSGGIRDVDIGSFGGERKKSVVVAMDEGLLVALNHRLEKQWARRLASPPVLLKTVAASIAVASENGVVSVFDSAGQLKAGSTLPGRPTCIAACDGGRSIVVGTDKGWVRAMALAE